MPSANVANQTVSVSQKAICPAKAAPAPPPRGREQTGSAHRSPPARWRTSEVTPQLERVHLREGGQRRFTQDGPIEKRERFAAHRLNLNRACWRLLRRPGRQRRGQEGERANHHDHEGEAMNRGPVVGKVPAEAGADCFAARLPAMASTGMITMNRAPASRSHGRRYRSPCLP